MKKETVLLGMSGGMDSACAVTVLQNEGYDVRGAVLAIQTPRVPWMRQTPSE